MYSCSNSTAASVRRFSRKPCAPGHKSCIFLYLTITQEESNICGGKISQLILPQSVKDATPPGGYIAGSSGALDLGEDAYEVPAEDLAEVVCRVAPGGESGGDFEQVRGGVDSFGLRRNAVEGVSLDNRTIRTI